MYNGGAYDFSRKTDNRDGNTDVARVLSAGVADFPDAFGGGYLSLVGRHLRTRDDDLAPLWGGIWAPPRCGGILVRRSGLMARLRTHARVSGG